MRRKGKSRKGRRALRYSDFNSLAPTSPAPHSTPIYPPVRQSGIMPRGLSVDIYEAIRYCPLSKVVELVIAQETLIF
jgi:hypothetical protein